MGLELRYEVRKAGGEPVSWPAFVLRIDGKDWAAMEALRAYTMATDNPALAADLAAVVDRQGGLFGNLIYMRGNPEGVEHEAD